MKKLIYCAAALVTALFAGSCQRELLDPAAQGNTVTYTVNMPEVATKAGESNLLVDKLVYAVYRVTDSNTSKEAALEDLSGTCEFVYQYEQTVTEARNIVSLELINNQKYVVAFWAQKDDKWFDHTNTNTGTTGYQFAVNGIDLTKYQPNDLYFDAFSGVDFIEVNGAASKGIELTRPFAQLNIATKLPKSFVAEVEETKVTVTGLAHSYNVVTKKGTINKNESGEDLPQVFEVTAPFKDENNSYVGFGEYERYISMNYVFIEDSQATATVSYEIKTAKHGTVNNTIDYVPLARNYKTNIVGNLLTSKVDYDVEIKNDWGTPNNEVPVVDADNIQAIIDNAVAGTTIQLKKGVNYGTIYIRPTAGNIATMKCEFHEFTTSDIEAYKAHLAEGPSHSPRYTSNISNITIIGAEGAVIEGVQISSSHKTQNATDYVVGKDINPNGHHYAVMKISNLKFENVNFTGKIDINSLEVDAEYDGITFEGCTFTTGGTAKANGAAIRYYNEANNGKVRNITVNNCTFNNCHQGVYVHHVNGITVTNNTFANTGHNAIGIQGHTGSAVNLKNVVITGNTFNKIGDRIIRFNEIGADSNITIQNNVATNSGDEAGEVIKATSIADGVVTSVKNNHWGVGKIVVNDELKDKGEFVATTAEELASLVNNATEDITVSLANDVVGKITLYQKEGVKVTIDGKGKIYTGGIQIFGDNAYTDYNTTIKNTNFVAKDLDKNTEACIYTMNNVTGKHCCAKNVTIDKCTFDGGETDSIIAAIRQNTNNANISAWTIKNCTVNSNMDSFLQVPNATISDTDILLVENCKVYSKNGANLNQTLTASFTGCEFDVKGYAVRVGESAPTYTAVGKTFTFTNCELKSQNDDGDAVVIVCGTAANATLNFVNSQLIGNPTITGHENAKVYINGVLQVANKVMHAESGLYYNGINQNHKSVFYVESAEDLRKAAAYFTGQTHSNEANYVTIELLTNIDLAGQDWTPWSVQYLNLNGNNFTISNMNVPASWRGGLFGYGGPVKVNDLTIKNATVSGAQAGILIGSAEGATVNNVKIAGNNTVTYVPYSNATYTEAWGGIGVVTGVINGSTINTEIVAGATVEINTNGIETDAPYVDIYTGYIQANNGAVVDNGTVKVNYSVDTPTELIAALKAVKDNSTIYLTGDITVTDNWDARYSGGKTTKPIVIDGNGNTLKLTGNVTDNNHNAVFRFENDAKVKNLTIDLSDAANTGQMRAISCKSTLSVETCTFIGKSDVNSRGIIFGEGANPNFDFEVSIKNSTFTNWKRGITDNENTQDIKSVTVENNTFTNANVNLSAYDSIVFNKNTMINSYVDLRTNTSSPTLEVTAQENTLDSAWAANNLIVNCNASNVNAQEGFTIQ